MHNTSLVWETEQNYDNVSLFRLFLYLKDDANFKLGAQIYFAN